MQGSVSSFEGRGKCFVSGVKMVKRHTKPNPQAGIEGGIIERESPIDISNLAIFNPSSKKPDKVSFKILEDGKVYINLKALDKITAKTSSFRLAVGDKKFFGSLEIMGLKCQLSEHNEFTDIVAYLQVKDTSNKSNDEVFVFNGWTFSSSPSIKPFDHPIYDIWLTKCY